MRFLELCHFVYLQVCLLQSPPIYNQAWVVQLEREEKNYHHFLSPSFIRIGIDNSLSHTLSTLNTTKGGNVKASRKLAIYTCLVKLGVRKMTQSS